MMTEEQTQDFADRAINLIKKLAPIFRDEDPRVCAAALAEFVSMYVASHHSLGEPEMEKVLQHFIDGVRKLTVFNVKRAHMLPAMH